MRKRGRSYQRRSSRDRLKNVVVSVEACLATFGHELFAQVAETFDGDLPAQGILDHLAAAFSSALDEGGQFPAHLFREADGQGGSHVLISITSPLAPVKALIDKRELVGEEQDVRVLLP